MLKQDTARLAVAEQAYRQLLEQAVGSHRAGELQQAERLYREILQAYPQDPVANHNMGILAMQLHGPAAGLLHFKAALEASSEQGQYWLSYIDALLQAGRQEAARQVLKQGRERGLQGDAVDALAQRLAQPNPTSAPSITLKTQATSPKVQAEKPAKTVIKNFPSVGRGSVKNKELKNKSLSNQRPDSNMVGKLEAAYNAKRYFEAEMLAREMTNRFPNYGFGWLALGVVLHEQGQGEKALEAKRVAVKLSPENAEAHSNLGLSLYELGYFAEAEESCHRALELKPDFAEAHCNLAVTLRELGRFSEAEASCRRAVELKPDYFNALNNLGNVLVDEGKLGEAEENYLRAIELNPYLNEVYNNLGNCLVRQFRFQDAETYYRRSIELSSDSNADAYNNLGNLLLDSNDIVQAISIYNKALAIEPDGAGLQSAVWLATLHYLSNEGKECRKMLTAAQSIVENSDEKFRISRIYYKFLNRILNWWETHPVSSSSAGVPLYVIGESHSLPAHGVLVPYRGHTMRCTSQWIAGCKQWHLGNSQSNRYKRKFEKIIQALPEQSTVLLLIGEIDCRPDEGILHSWNKTQEKPLSEVAESTAQAYVSYVAKTASRYRHRIVIGGVPATNYAHELAPEDAKKLIGLIKIFNEYLRGAAFAAGMDFLDIHALTDRGDGIARGEWHIDAHHLLPSAIAEAFNNHLIQFDQSDA